MDNNAESRFAQMLRRHQEETAQKLGQIFSQREAQVNHKRNPRLAITALDVSDTPTYPTQGIDGANTFPFIFIDAGFTNTAGRHTAAVTNRSDVIQAKAYNITGNYIPAGTVVQVWQDRGVDSSKPGEWWCEWHDNLRFGIASEDIDVDDQGTVREWSPNNYDAETDSTRDWLVRNLVSNCFVPEGAEVFFCQIGSVAYILTVNDGCNVPFLNDSGEEMPPYGVGRVVDDYDTSGRVTIEKMNGEFQRRVLVNSGAAVADGDYGRGTWLETSHPCCGRVLLTGGGPPVLNEEWGPAPDDWGLQANRPGFHLLGDSEVVDDGYTVRAIQREVTRLKGNLTEGAIDIDDSSFFVVTSGPIGSEVDAGWDSIECWHRGCENILNSGEDLRGYIVWQDSQWIFYEDCCPTGGDS